VRVTGADSRYLQRAIELSRGYLDDDRRWPFGALVVVGGEVVGEGVNRVVETSDPSAHAEVMALRAAGAALGRHLFSDGVLYSSSEPCPMCLTACYWACVPRVVFAATTGDVAAHGLRDLALYRELARAPDERSMTEDACGGTLRQHAVSVLRDWTERLPGAADPGC
jgi:tRNA(Arg) A34 adenosine deaminase TadA